VRLTAPAGFGGRLRGKGPDSGFVNPGPRRAAHPVHESVRTTHIYLAADLALKEQALNRTTPPGGTPGRYQPSDRLLAFLEAL
jgi:hypothetical protein